MFPTNTNSYMPTGQAGGYYPYGSPLFQVSTPSTYTSPSGNTNQGQQLSQLQKVLQSIVSQPPQNIPQDQLQKATTDAQAAAANAQGGANQFAQNTQNKYIQQLVNPLQLQYGNMDQLFQLYLADKGMSTQAAQYANPGGNLNPYANPQLLAASQQGQQQLQGQNQADQAKIGQMTTSEQPGVTTPAASPATNAAPNPFLGSTQSVIDSTSNLPVAPGIVTSEMAQPLNAGSNLMSLLNSLIGSQQTVAQNATQSDIAAYQDKMNVLNTLANTLGSALTNQQSLNLPGGAASVQGSLNSVKNDVNKGMTFTDLLQKYDTDPNMTASKVLEIYNAKHAVPGDKWGPAQITPEMADAYGLKQTQTNLAKKPIPTKTIGGEVFEYNPATKAYDIPAGGTDASNKATTMLDNYLTKWKAMSPEEKYAPSTLSNLVPGLFPNRAYLDTDFFTQIEPLLRKTVVGGRITQQEMTWLRNALPKAGDSNQSAAAKIQAIKDALSSGITNAAGGTTSATSKGKGDNDPLGIR